MVNNSLHSNRNSYRLHCLLSSSSLFFLHTSVSLPIPSFYSHFSPTLHFPPFNSSFLIPLSSSSLHSSFPVPHNPHLPSFHAFSFPFSSTLLLPTFTVFPVPFFLYPYPLFFSPLIQSFSIFYPLSSSFSSCLLTHNLTYNKELSSTSQASCLSLANTLPAMKIMD